MLGPAFDENTLQLKKTVEVAVKENW